MTSPFDMQFVNEARGCRSIVYIIATESSSLVKIGTTASELDRFRALQSGSAAKLKIIRAYPGGRRTEGEFHREFADRRVRTEWFQFHPEMMTFRPRVQEVVKSEGNAQDNVSILLFAKISAFATGAEKLKATAVFETLSAAEQNEHLSDSVSDHLQRALLEISEISGCTLQEAASLAIEMLPQFANAVARSTQEAV